MLTWVVKVAAYSGTLSPGAAARRSSMVAARNGRRPGAEDANHGNYGKTKRLLEEHRASKRGDRSRRRRFAAKPRHQAETVGQRKNDHHRKQQDLQTQQSAVGRPN